MLRLVRLRKRRPEFQCVPHFHFLEHQRINCLNCEDHLKLSSEDCAFVRATAKIEMSENDRIGARLFGALPKITICPPPTSPNNTSLCNNILIEAIRKQPASDRPWPLPDRACERVSSTRRCCKKERHLLIYQHCL